MVRLVSLLHCAALHRVSDAHEQVQSHPQSGQDTENEIIKLLRNSLAPQRYEILDIVGIDPEGLRFLDTFEEHRSLILLQWIQRLVYEAEKSGMYALQNI